jgi:cyclopropane-fatty-acyl-phospholipid synthase
MSAPASRSRSWIALCRRGTLALLRGIATGRLELVEPGGTVHRLGPGGEPSAHVELRDPRAWTMLAHGSRGVAHGYAEGWWESPDVGAVVRVAARNAAALDAAGRRTTPLRAPFQRLRGLGTSPSAREARSNIHRHYDLGDELFELMLDETMTYSCGWFARPESSLRSASLAKLELVCHKLDLGPDDHLLEIGTGWGSLALHAATTRGCRVTTTTISGAQHRHASERVAEAGVRDRVTGLSRDYRALTGCYSAIVSIEMIEAVGWRDFGTFFAKCDELLAPDGAMLLQAITIDDRVYELEKASKSFIRTEIFPNGCLPSNQVIAEQVARRTALRMVHHEDMTAHYVSTLQHWRENVEAHSAQLAHRGYDERFQRLWRFYLAYCQAGFVERRINVGQTMLAGPRWRGAVPAMTGAAGTGDLRAAVSGADFEPAATRV